MIPWSSSSRWENAGSKPCFERLLRRCGWPGPAWPGIHTLSIGSHSSVGPQFFSPRPMQICGKFSRKKFVKCSLESTTHAWTPRSTASRRPGPARRRSCCAAPRGRPSAPRTSSARATSSTPGLSLPPAPPLFLLPERLEELPVVVAGEPGRPAEPVEQHLVQAELVEPSDVPLRRRLCARRRSARRSTRRNRPGRHRRLRCSPRRPGPSRRRTGSAGTDSSLFLRSPRREIRSRRPVHPPSMRASSDQ